MTRLVLILAFISAVAAHGQAQTTGAVSAPRRVFGFHKATDPEPILFSYMRNLAATPSGDKSYRLRRDIEQYRILAHDRKRKVGVKWLGPDDFVRRRRVFLAKTAEAEKLFRETNRKRRRKSEPLTTSEMLKRSKAKLQLIVAAKGWLDPTIRQFLMATAHWQKGDKHQAEALFSNCLKTSPRVAAFWQGHGLALMQLNRPLHAVRAFMEALRLRPESGAALDGLKKAIDQTPGTKLKHPDFLAAHQLLDEYKDVRLKRSRRDDEINWLMPGDEDDWEVSNEFGLPRPPYDRLVFKQAIGVPVGPNALLVDEAIVGDALEIFVRLGDGKVVPASTGRRRRSSRSRSGRPDAMVLYVQGVEFSPLAADEDAALTAGQKVTAFGLAAYEDMGSSIRKIAGEVATAPTEDAPAKLTVTALPGEAACPVVTDSGQLVGMLAAKLDTFKDGGGEDRFIPLKDLGVSVKKFYKAPRNRSKRDIETVDVAGDHFIIYATFGEKLTK